jgi:hypothetical protein
MKSMKELTLDYYQKVKVFQVYLKSKFHLEFETICYFPIFIGNASPFIIIPFLDSSKKTYLTIPGEVVKWNYSTLPKVSNS